MIITNKNFTIEQLRKEYSMAIANLVVVFLQKGHQTIYDINLHTLKARDIFKMVLTVDEVYMNKVSFKLWKCV